jgi:hypothetical protein
MNKDWIKNFVVTGCSFTASILQDVSPTAEGWNTRASHWPHTVFAKLGPENKTFVNLAMGAGGNTAAFTNLVYFLNKHRLRYQPNNTLIGFNITALTRKDGICDVNDGRQSMYQESIDVQKYLDLSWYPEDVSTHDNLDHLVIQNACKVIESIVYLEHFKYQHFFMLMNDGVYTHSPKWFQEFLDLRKNKTWILLNDYLSMESYSNSIQGWRSPDDHHPNLETNRIIGNKVLDFLGINE